MFANTSQEVVIPRNTDWDIHVGKRHSWIQKFVKHKSRDCILSSHGYGSRGFDKLDPGVCLEQSVSVSLWSAEVAGETLAGAQWGCCEPQRERKVESWGGRAWFIKGPPGSHSFLLKKVWVEVRYI